MILKHYRVISLVALLLLASTVWADVAQVNPRRASGGYVKDFRNHSFGPSATPSTLSKQTTLNEDQQRIADQAAKILAHKSNLSVLLIEQGRIIFEGYNLPATAETQQFSWSMSKSITGYLVGELLCDGKISSLDQPAKTHAPLLDNTIYGDASIRNLLTMSSGIKKAVFGGQQHRHEWENWRDGKTTARELLKLPQRLDIRPGREFRYSSMDTMSLAEIVDHNGGFAKNYHKFWSKVHSESSSHWVVDKNDQVLSPSGLSMITRDWARTAMYVTDKIRNDRGCLGDFYRQATTKQLSVGNDTMVGKSFSGYGFQTWTDPKNGGRSFWWVGYGGQRVAVDPDKQKIMVITSHREDYMLEVNELFRSFQRM